LANENRRSAGPPTGEIGPRSHPIRGPVRKSASISRVAQSRRQLDPHKGAVVAMDFSRLSGLSKERTWARLASRPRALRGESEAGEAEDGPRDGQSAVAAPFLFH
jgi:hypothetical protein